MTTMLRDVFEAMPINQPAAQPVKRGLAITDLEPRNGWQWEAEARRHTIAGLVALERKLWPWQHSRRNELAHMRRFHVAKLMNCYDLPAGVAVEAPEGWLA